MPEDGYGWEKSLSERMARHSWKTSVWRTRGARYHNVYGPWGLRMAAREGAGGDLPKVIQAQLLRKADDRDLG